MKKILSLVLSVVMLLSCFALSAVAWVDGESVSGAYPIEKKSTSIDPNTGISIQQCSGASNSDGSFTWTSATNEAWMQMTYQMPNGGVANEDAVVLEMVVSMTTTNGSDKMIAFLYYDNSTTYTTAASSLQPVTINTGTIRTEAHKISRADGTEKFRVYIPLGSATVGVQKLTSIKFQPYNQVSSAGQSLTIYEMNVLNYAPDYSIMPNDTYSAKVVSKDTAYTVVNTEVFKDKLCYKLSNSNPVNATQALIEVKNLLLDVNEYNYIKINCYYDAEVGTSINLGNAYINWSSGLGVSDDANAVRFTAQNTVSAGEWVTLVIPIDKQESWTDTGYARKIALQLHGGSGIWNINTGCDVYISSITFSKDTTAVVDPVVNDEIVCKAAQNGTNGNIRLVATLEKGLNLEDYKEVGFELVAETDTQIGKATKTATTVYTSLTAAGDTILASAYDAEYFVAIEFLNLGSTVNATVEVKSYVMKNDGTKIYGAAATMTIAAGQATALNYN